MIVYAESSAVVAWLLGEPRAAAVAAELRDADRVITSALTRAECARAILRGVSLRRVTKREAADLMRTYDEAEAGWDELDVSQRVLANAGAPFPVEPVRPLDAIHLASAHIAHTAFGDVGLLSFDERVRANASALGLTALPARVP